MLHIDFNVYFNILHIDFNVDFNILLLYTIIKCCIFNFNILLSPTIQKTKKI